MSPESINYYFEDFCFDAESRQLLKNGSPVSLTAKALDVLQVLVQKHGKFVRKEEIIDRVWNDSFVEDANLTQHIYVLRKTLGQTKNGNPLIETMPKRGYRFNAVVLEKNNTLQNNPLNDGAHNQANLISRNEPVKLLGNHQTHAGRINGYRFGDFRIDANRRMLYRENQPVTLPAKVFDTLLYLVKNAGHLVGKDELMDNIWQERYVEENNLTQKIFILRRLLGDNKNEHQYIVTVPGEGYIFVAPVEKCSDEAFITTVENFSSPGSFLKKTPTFSLAVLPFKAFNPDQSSHDEDLWGIGFADSLISQLSRYKELVVRPTSTILKFRNQNHELAAISRELQVTHLIEGFIQSSESKLKISVQLYESKTGGIIWADNFVSRDTDTLETQNRISNRISESLALKLDFKLLPAEISLPKNFEAFQEYIKGKFYWNARTVEGLKKAIAHVQKALEVEPTFAMAYLGLADSYNLLAGQHSFMSPKDAFPKAKAASERALELSGGRLAEAYASLAFVTHNFDWNHALAYEYFQRAIELKPNYATAHHWYGEALASEGHFDESIEELKKAQLLDPLSSAITADLAQTFFLAGRLDECRFLLDQILNINPRFVRGLYLYGHVYQQLKQFEKAVEVLRQAFEISPDEPAILAELGCALAAANRKKEARHIAEELEKMSGKRYVPGFLIARLYSVLNETDKAFEWLENALQNRDVWLTWINVFPGLDSLRGNPRFGSISAKIKQS